MTDMFDLPLPAAIDQWGILRQRRRLVLIGAHVCKDQPSLFSHGIREMLYLAGKLAVLRLRGHFQTLAANIKQPPVIRAANPAGFDVAVFQRSAAMRAMKAQKTELAEFIAKQHELLS